VASPVSLGTLITRVRQRIGMEVAAGASGTTATITDWEITDCLNVSLSNKLYDVVRQAVGDQYYRKQYIITTVASTQAYDLPGDFLNAISVDVWLQSPSTPMTTNLKINARRYMEYERNFYQNILLGWSEGCTVLYTLSAQQIVFQPTPITSSWIGLNYVPTSPQLGGGQSPTTPGTPNNYTDTWDDINGWAEIAILDAAAKCALKLKQFDTMSACAQMAAAMRQDIQALIQLRHAGEPERAQFPQAVGWGDGWRE
jgi:hypothetical protein